MLEVSSEAKGPSACSGLSDEADELREILKKLPAEKDSARPQKDLQDVQIFWERFPQVKREVEGRIRRLHALADEVSKVHRDCTVSNVVASSTGVASGIMGLAGLFLAPFSGGLSLGLALGGMGLGAAASVTSAATSIVEGNNSLSAKTEACNLISDSMKTMNDYFVDAAKILPKVVLASEEFVQFLGELGRVSHIFRASAHPQVRGVRSALRSSRASENEGRGFGGGASILGGVFTGISLGMDVTSLVQDSLSEGAESKFANELRQWAQVLDRNLKYLVKIQAQSSKETPPS
ncbi:apolipoprotein L3-like [Thomomys bottae]